MNTHKMAGIGARLATASDRGILWAISSVFKANHDLSVIEQAICDERAWIATHNGDDIVGACFATSSGSEGGAIGFIETLPEFPEAFGVLLNAVTQTDKPLKMQVDQTARDKIKALENAGFVISGEGFRQSRRNEVNIFYMTTEDK